MYYPIQPSKESIEELRKIIVEDYEREPTEQESFDIAYNVLNYFNLLLHMDNEQKQAMQFEYPDDEQFFAMLLAEGSKENLRAEFIHRFDFREPSTKRADFDKLKGLAMKEMVQQRRTKCELHLIAGCDDQKLVLDHIVPLSSNELNKHLRKMRAPQGKKVPTQSFGSNHFSNFLVACEKCNNFKKHRFIKKDKSGWTIYSFKK